MWKISKFADTAQRVILKISGRIAAENLFDLRHAVSSEERPDLRVELDLENVRLVDQPTITYLACCEASGIPLRNCPAYIRGWIEREKAEPNNNGKE